jgi:hypothetical protein
MAAEKILAMLAGHDSKKPVAFDALVESCGLESATLQMVLDRMFKSIPASVNCCEITRGGKTQMYYWPTCVIEKAARQDIVINPRKLPPSGHLTKPPMADKAIKSMEKSQMKKPDTKDRRSASINDVLDIITATPGIRREDVMLRLVDSDGANKDRVATCISNAIYNKKIRKDDVNGLWPVVVKNAPESGLASAQSESSEKPSEQMKKPEGMEISDSKRSDDEGSKGMEKPEESAAQPSSNNVDREAYIPLRPLRIPVSFNFLAKHTAEREYGKRDVYIDADGRFTILLNGQVRVVFPPKDTASIKRLFEATDLESLCD